MIYSVIEQQEIELDEIIEEPNIKKGKISVNFGYEFFVYQNETEDTGYLENLEFPLLDGLSLC